MTAICRLCLAERGTFYPLFRLEEVETQTMPLAMQVTMCTAVPISKNDNLPKRICINCHSFICEWYMFRRKCRQADASLKAAADVKIAPTRAPAQASACVADGHVDHVGAPMPMPAASQNQVCEGLTISARLEATPTKGPSKRKKCNLCPDSFTFFRDLKQHKVVVHSIARKPVSRMKKTPQPKAVASNLSPWRCCGQVFIAKSLFRNHIRKFHPGDKPFSCDECGKKDFISAETLRRHKMLHSGRYACSACGKAFTCRAILRIHERDKHEHDRPFVCDVCGKAYVTELLLGYHQRCHTGEKKYVCEMCGVAVVTSSSLAKHRRTHDAVKPHVCEHCGKGFIVKARLVEHVRVHTGERPFACDHCGKRFTMQDKLKRHKRTHEQKAFCCDICGNAFSTNHGLAIHRKSHITRQQE